MYNSEMLAGCCNNTYNNQLALNVTIKFTLQVDQKSYLLDFKSLINEESETVSVATNVNSLGAVPTPVQSGVVQPSLGHHTMEFFEMCAALIIQLAR